MVLILAFSLSLFFFLLIMHESTIGTTFMKHSIATAIIKSLLEFLKALNATIAETLSLQAFRNTNLISGLKKIAFFSFVPRSCHF